MVKAFFIQLLIGALGGLIPTYLVVFYPPDEVKASVQSAWNGSKSIIDLMSAPVEVPAWYLLLAFLACFVFFAGLARWLYIWLSSNTNKLSRAEKGVIGFFRLNHGKTFTRKRVSEITGVPLIHIEVAIDRLLARGLLDDYLILGRDAEYALSEAGRAYAIGS